MSRAAPPWAKDSSSRSPDRWTPVSTVYLMTGDRERTGAALEDLCAWIDSRVAAARSGG
ncbi:hypothetical protein [Nocardiopsis sp. M1B1]|uniref:hypothetical protein n=1 Tax=Nocardiopsis sp. M1B1 TaxID=3450454 RepID=UPI0040398694